MANRRATVTVKNDIIFDTGGVIRTARLSGRSVKLKNTDITMRWFPKYAICANNTVLKDQTYDDFDEQSERLVGHDQIYLQLTAGAFRGRFMSGFLGPEVSVHIEYCNQALEQSIVGSDDAYTLGVILSDGPEFRFNGQPWNRNDVLIVPPRADLHIRSPLNGSVMAIAIDQHLFLRQPGLGPHVAEWLEGLNANIQLLRAPKFAERLREDTRHALENVSASGSIFDNHATIMGHALIAGIASKLSLELATARQPIPEFGANSYLRFLECRARIHNEWEKIEGLSSLVSGEQFRMRSLQESFATQVSVGPLTYLRLLRLHLAKRALMRAKMSDQTIGDIAATFGFWNWSRFTQQYQKQFGELPSETRSRVCPTLSKKIQISS